MKDIMLLEQVQRRATRMIAEFKGKSYEERLEILGLITFENRRMRADLIEVFNILKDLKGLTRNFSSRGIYLTQEDIL